MRPHWLHLSHQKIAWELFSNPHERMQSIQSRAIKQKPWSIPKQLSCLHSWWWSSYVCLQSGLNLARFLWTRQKGRHRRQRRRQGRTKDKRSTTKKDASSQWHGMLLASCSAAPSECMCILFRVTDWHICCLLVVFRNWSVPEVTKGATLVITSKLITRAQISAWD